MQAKQTTLKGFLQLDSDSEHEEVSVYTPSPQKGATKLPEMWTRVVSRDLMSHQRITVFDIEKDLNSDKVLKAVRSGAARESGEFVFDPDEWKGKSDELKIADHTLSEEQLRLYAGIATEVRRKFQEKADAALDEGKVGGAMEIEESKESMPKMKRNYLPIQKQEVRKELLLGHEHNSGSAKRKRLSLSQVSAQTRVAIVKLAATKSRTHKEIGELYNVRPIVVS